MLMKGKHNGSLLCLCLSTVVKLMDTEKNILHQSCHRGLHSFKFSQYLQWIVTNGLADFSVGNGLCMALLLLFELTAEMYVLLDLHFIFFAGSQRIWT